jgi:hypothetical protein
MEKNTDENGWSLKAILFFIFGGLFLWFLYKLQGKKKEPYVTTRKAIAKQYGVDLKTLNKWVQVFADTKVLSYTNFTKQRGLTQSQYDYLIQLFGEPTEGKSKYSKFDIVASDEGIGHNDYRDVRESIKQSPDKCIVSPEVYAQLNFFPPRIGLALKNQMS